MDTAATQKSDFQTMQKSNGRDWAVVDRSPNRQNTPKKMAPVNKTQITASNINTQFNSNVHQAALSNSHDLMDVNEPGHGNQTTVQISTEGEDKKMAGHVIQNTGKTGEAPSEAGAKI